MSPEPRDELDRALAAGLGGLAAENDDPDAVLDSMRPRLRRARTRHRVARASVLAVAIVGVASVAAVAMGTRDDNRRVQVEAPGTSVTAPAPSTTRPRTTTTVRRPTTPTTTRTPTSGTTPATSPSVPGVGTTPGADGPPPTNAPAPQQRTYVNDGGTVTVRLENGRLTLVSYRPAGGYTATVHRNEPDDIEVRFPESDDGDEERIRVRVQDGALRVETD